MIPQPLINATYLNLATFRKNGNAVRTPVWFSHDGRTIYVLSAGEAGKIKRLRNSPRAEVAPCTYSGKLTGDWYKATATLITDTGEIQHALACLQGKYGWQMRAFNFFSWMGRRINKRAYIRITIST